MKQNYELLAPVGSFEMLQTAINAGANAVYLGLKEFNMRDNAKNFSLTDLKKARKICNQNKVKIYLTLNTIIYDKEINKLERVIKKAKDYVNAIICWDLSVIQLCRKYKIPFHVSTQASVSNTESAKFYKKLGAQRIILARELNLKQIKEISKIKGINIECFCHGAMCVAVSGRCFTSQFLFNKSANRGKCIQPCRRTYTIKDTQQGYELKLDNNKVMSAKDLCTLPFIEKLKKSGITSFKIEGRNRDPRYIDTVIKVYKKALNKKLTKKEISDSLEQLKKVYNREFSSGFYLGLPTKDDFARVEHSAATQKKHFIGKVEHYYPKMQVAIIKLVSSVKIGDELVIIGKTIGLKKHKITSMEINNKKVKYAKKNQKIGIKIPEIKKNNEIYLIKKN
ncbi:MAG: peptidase U32 family protein [Nanoarchaeota archaeon]